MVLKPHSSGLNGWFLGNFIIVVDQNSLATIIDDNFKTVIITYDLSLNYSQFYMQVLIHQHKQYSY